jgi:hypothetical protein
MHIRCSYCATEHNVELKDIIFKFNPGSFSDISREINCSRCSRTIHLSHKFYVHPDAYDELCASWKFLQILTPCCQQFTGKIKVPLTVKKRSIPGGWFSGPTEETLITCVCTSCNCDYDIKMKALPNYYEDNILNQCK